jgi:hypothetical protein
MRGELVSETDGVQSLAPVNKQTIANPMYATDPVVQAEADAAKENGADGTANGFWKQSASRLKTFAAC